MWAVQDGPKDEVVILSQRDIVNADSQDKNGRTLLSWAAKNGAKDVVETLLQRNDVNIDSKDSYGDTPLVHAMRGRDAAIVQLLLERDANASEVDVEGYRFRHCRRALEVIRE